MKQYVKELGKVFAALFVTYGVAYAALRAAFAVVDWVVDRIDDVRTKLKTSKRDRYFKVPNETSDDDFEE